MKLEEIKAAMLARIKENGLPVSAKMLWEDSYFGVLVQADGTVTRHPGADYGPSSGTIDDLPLSHLSLLLESQENPAFYESWA